MAVPVACDNGAVGGVDGYAASLPPQHRFGDIRAATAETVFAIGRQQVGGNFFLLGGGEEAASLAQRPDKGLEGFALGDEGAGRVYDGNPAAGDEVEEMGAGRVPVGVTVLGEEAEGMQPVPKIDGGEPVIGEVAEAVAAYPQILQRDEPAAQAADRLQVSGGAGVLGVPVEGAEGYPVGIAAHVPVQAGDPPEGGGQ